MPRVTHGGTAIWTEGWTDTDGETLWEGLPPGRYDVEISAVGYGSVTGVVAVNALGVATHAVTLYPKN
jgi:hypothetical protein